MSQSIDRQNYIAPEAETFTVCVEDNLLQSPAPGGINGCVGTTSYEEDEDWN